MDCSFMYCFVNTQNGNIQSGIVSAKDEAEAIAKVYIVKGRFIHKDTLVVKALSKDVPVSGRVARTNDGNSERENLAKGSITYVFLTQLIEVLKSGKVMLMNLNDNTVSTNIEAGSVMIGYYDKKYYYMLAGVTFERVKMLCRKKDIPFPLTAKALYRQLRDEALLDNEIAERETTTKVKWINGRAMRALWIPRSLIPDIEL